MAGPESRVSFHCVPRCDIADAMSSKTQLKTSADKEKVFLVDDHPIVRQGLALLIDREADLTVCGEADGGFVRTSLFSTFRSMVPTASIF
jgi:hypothetical protein